MKRVIIGSLVATVIFFVFQAIMWVGGIHKNYSDYTPKQDSIITALSHNLDKDGLYMIPNPDPNSPDRGKAEQELMKKYVGKPWAMVFYHASMTSGGEASTMIMGLIQTLLASLIAAFVIWYGNFRTYGSRFFVSFAFAAFAIFQSVLSNMNWWRFPWNFVSAQVIDLVIGWGLISLWFAWILKKKAV